MLHARGETVHPASRPLAGEAAHFESEAGEHDRHAFFAWREIRLHDTVQGIVQANMMHVTHDGRRLYVTNSAISSIDYSPRYALRLIQIGPDGRMKLDPQFALDFAKAPHGPARPHDMLLN